METSKSFGIAQKYLGEKVHVVFDRPLGTRHPRYGFVYEVNYGYLPGVKAPDGEDLDTFYLRVSEPLQKAEGICIAIVHRENDDDDKLVVVPDGVEISDEEISKEVACSRTMVQIEDCPEIVTTRYLGDSLKNQSAHPYGAWPGRFFGTISAK